MGTSYEEFHAKKKKNERLRSFEDTVKNSFDEKLKILDDCFEEAKSSEIVTHVQIFDNHGRYYFIKVVNSFRDTLQCFNIKGWPRNMKYKSWSDITRYILFRTVSLKKKKNSILTRKMCNRDCVLRSRFRMFSRCGRIKVLLL